MNLMPRESLGRNIVIVVARIGHTKSPLRVSVQPKETLWQFFSKLYEII